MNITDIKFKSFANGYNHYCTDCRIFFSVQIMGSEGIKVSHCPCCGGLYSRLSGIEALLIHCKNTNTDPVNLYHAFPHNEPIPQSRTGATPHQVRWIIGCAKADKEKNLPVTVDFLAGQLGFDKEIVKKVFEELHITETGGTK